MDDINRAENMIAIVSLFIYHNLIVQLIIRNI